MSPRFATLFGAALALMPLACSGEHTRKPTFAVTGKVTINGKPAEYATVVLHPAGPIGPNDAKPRGKVGADGEFTLSTYGTNDGAPAGDYPRDGGAVAGGQAFGRAAVEPPGR